MARKKKKKGGRKIKMEKRKQKGLKISYLLQMMLKPVLLGLLPVMIGMIDLWKIQLLDRLPKVSTKDLKDFLSDQIDLLSESIQKQIKKGLGG
ncbi:hypothetical protein ES703_73761 [subsurface metagenome]